MKIKRFFASDVRRAMTMVKEELGEDAVILSNRRVNGGVEIISAIDYDEQALQQKIAAEQPEPIQSFDDLPPNVASFQRKTKPASVAKPEVVWSQEPTLMEMRGDIKNLRGLLENQLASLTQSEFQQQHPFRCELQQRLSRLGFGRHLTAELLDSLVDETNVDDMWRRLLGKIAVRLAVDNDDILTRGGVVALVGPTGVGKTTTIAKLAARYALRHGSRSVALISADNYRIGAHEQLKAYARILDVPIRIVDSAESLQISLDYFCDKRLVLIDTAGMSQRDLRLRDQFSILQSENARIRNYLVASVTTRLSGLEEIFQGFSDLELNGCVLTKIDEATSLGHALDVVIRHGLPVSYVSDGQRVPEDLQPARAHTLVSRSVAVMQESIALLDDEMPVRVGE